MKFGLMFANTGPHVTGQGAIDLAKAAEDLGFESIWTVEHVVVPKGYHSEYPYDPSGKMPGGLEDFPIPDPLMWLAWIGSVTSTINLATGVMILPQRNPLVLAKSVATLDSMSGGRVRLGIGVGWLEEEFKALDIAFEKRGERSDDYIRAMRALWEDELSTYNGDFAEFENVYSKPKPANGTVPITIGGHTKRAARRAGELGDGFFPGKGKPTELEALFATVREAAEASGRDYDAIELTTGGKPDAGYVERLAGMGVHRMILPPADPATLEKWSKELIQREY